MCNGSLQRRLQGFVGPRCACCRPRYIDVAAQSGSAYFNSANVTSATIRVTSEESRRNNRPADNPRVLHQRLREWKDPRRKWFFGKAYFLSLSTIASCDIGPRSNTCRRSAYVLLPPCTNVRDARVVPAHSRCHQFVTRITEGSSHFVASVTAPVASGCNCQAATAPAGKRYLSRRTAIAALRGMRTHVLFAGISRQKWIKDADSNILYCGTRGVHSASCLREHQQLAK
ncbi:hypothetical protein B0G84_8244 [Paraburkholderia sp. BL8N3]|nr:hypothetical protein B0G84_8244 [Paraburkholderia sp. BL8N3]